MSKMGKLFLELVEATAERDIKYVKKAQAFANKLDRFLRSKNSKNVLVLGEGSGWWGRENVIWMDTIHIDKKLGLNRVTIVFKHKSSGRSGDYTFGGTANVVNWIDTKIKPIALYVIPDRDDLKDYVSQWVDDGRYGKELPPKKLIKLTNNQKEILIHELIHIFDYIRGGAGIEKSASSAKKLSSGDVFGYYNDPKEFNAYFQEGLSNLMSAFNAALKRPDAAEFLFSMLGYTYYDFSLYLQYNPYWRKEFIENMNDVTRKKFKSRLFQLYGGLVDHANKAMLKKTGKSYRELFPEKEKAALVKKYGGTLAHTEWPTKGSMKATNTRFTPSYWGRKI